MSSMTYRRIPGLLPLVMFLLYLPFSSSIDLAIANWFMHEDGTFHAPSWCLFVYTYGLLPGQLLFVGSVCLLCFSLCTLRASSIRWPAFFLAATLLIGSGCIGHGIFKQFWNRPRPKQVVLFGGKYPYCPLTIPYKGSSDRFLRSLPSGHATMGFYFLALYILGKRLSQKWVQRTGLVLTIMIGGLLSWARLAQGGHFFSDIVVSLLIMWTTAIWIDYLTHRARSDVGAFRPSPTNPL